MESKHPVDHAKLSFELANTSLACYPAYLNAMVEGHAYRLETYALPLRDGVFPGLCMERQFIKRLCVEGVELVELQRANGSRHVIAASGIERISPLGRANLEPDTLRLSPLATTLANEKATPEAPGSMSSI